MDLSKVEKDKLIYNLTLMNNWSKKSTQYKAPKEVMFGIWLTLGVGFTLIKYLWKKEID